MSGDIHERYTSKDHQSKKSAQAAHYDLLREHGYSREYASEKAAKAAEMQMQTLDIGAAGKMAVVSSATAKSRFRVPFDWEK